MFDDSTMTELINRLMKMKPDMSLGNPYGRVECLEKLVSVAMNGGETGWYRSMNDYVSLREREYAQGSAITPAEDPGTTGV